VLTLIGRGRKEPWYWGGVAAAGLSFFVERYGCIATETVPGAPLRFILVDADSCENLLWHLMQVAMLASLSIGALWVTESKGEGGMRGVACLAYFITTGRGGGC
jgi:hypothetical protein